MAHLDLVALIVEDYDTAIDFLSGCSSSRWSRICPRPPLTAGRNAGWWCALPPTLSGHPLAICSDPWRPQRPPLSGLLGHIFVGKRDGSANGGQIGRSQSDICPSLPTPGTACGAEHGRVRTDEFPLFVKRQPESANLIVRMETSEDSSVDAEVGVIHVGVFGRASHPKGDRTELI